MVSAKYRKMDFVKSRDKNKEWFEADTMPILFGMMQCKDFKRLIITEGQIDSLTVAECGFDNSVSVPNGATGFTWISNCYDWLGRFDEIVIFGDCEKNKITLVDDIVSRFPLKKIKRCVRLIIWAKKMLMIYSENMGNKLSGLHRKCGNKTSQSS